MLEKQIARAARANSDAKSAAQVTVVTSIVKCGSKNSASASKIFRAWIVSHRSGRLDAANCPTRIVVRDLHNRSTLGSQAVASVAGRSKAYD